MTTQPNNFSTRRAARLAKGWTDDRSPRLGSFGTHAQPINSFGTKGTRRYSPPRTVQVEMLVDVNHPKHVYARQEGSAPVRVDGVRSEPESREDIGTLRKRAEPSGHFPAGKTNDVLERALIVRNDAGAQFKPLDAPPPEPGSIRWLPRAR